MNPHGKEVLITGGSSGIGAAAARHMARQGAHTLLVARRTDALDRVASDIVATGGTAQTFTADLADPQAVGDVTERVRAEAGVPDIIVNAAGAGRWKELAQTDVGELQQMLYVPALSAMLMTRAFVSDMIARGHGQIINVSSPASFLAWPNACGYIASRRALQGFNDALRAELHGTGVQVTAVVLGPVDSPYWQHNPDSAKNQPRRLPGVMPVLSTDEAAARIVAAVTKTRRQMVSPPVFRAAVPAERAVPAQHRSRDARLSLNRPTHRPATITMTGPASTRTAARRPKRAPACGRDGAILAASRTHNERRR